MQGADDGVVGANGHSVFGAGSGSVVVSLVVTRVISVRRFVAIDRDVLDFGVVVAVGHVRAVPVHETTSPLDRTLSVARETTRPKRELHTRRSLRVFVLFGGLVVGFVAFQGTHNLVVDRPVDVIGLPVNLVRVPVLTSVRDIVNVFAIAVYNLVSP